MIGILIFVAYLLIGYLIGLAVVWHEVRQIRKHPHFTKADLERYHREHNGSGMIIILALVWPLMIVAVILVYGTDFIVKRF